MPTRGFVNMRDWGNEPTSVSFALQDVDVLNIESVEQDLDEIKDGCLAFLGGEVLSVGYTKTIYEAPNPVTDSAAQREAKWVLTYRDDTQFLDAANTIANPGYRKLFTVEFGTAITKDGGGDTYLSPNSDLADPTDTEVDAFLDAILPNIRSPYNHTAAVTPTNTFVQLKYVGRNS